MQEPFQVVEFTLQWIKFSNLSYVEEFISTSNLKNQNYSQGRRT
jgi:hypothetical protein